jgi:methyl-accepting chemotaxis protein
MKRHRKEGADSEVPGQGGLCFRTKALILVAAINVIITASFTGVHYLTLERSVLRGIDDHLLASAHAIRYILAEGYHARITVGDPGAHDEYVRSVQKLSEHAHRAGVTRLYTLFESQGRILLASTSATDEELRKGAFRPIFAVFRDPAGTLRGVFEDRKTSSGESRDSDHRYRSAYVPVIMSSGMVYVMAADLDMRSVEASLVDSLGHSLLIGGILFAVTCVFSYVFFRRFDRSLSAVRNRAGEIRETRDLTSVVQGSGGAEAAGLAWEFNALIGLIREMAGLVAGTVNAILKTSQDLVTDGDELVFRTQDQNDIIHETSKTLDDLALDMENNARDAAKVESDLIAFNEAILGRVSLIRTMTDAVKEIDLSSRSIEKVVSVMNETAFQVNLLTLSASVAAERAGEQGSGFWIVVEEIRHLARRTAEASRDIEQLACKNAKVTRRGVELVLETSEFFHAIIEQISRIVPHVSAVVQACHEQGEGIGYINKTFSRTRDILGRNTDLAGMLAKSTRELHDVVIPLREMVRRYKGL